MSLYNNLPEIYRGILKQIVRLGSNPEDCWLWSGDCDTSGYGIANIGKVTIYVHRFTFELENGVIAPGNHIHHNCRRKLCVKPSHLQELTVWQHMMYHLHGIGKENIYLIPDDALYVNLLLDNLEDGEINIGR